MEGCNWVKIYFGCVWMGGHFLLVNRDRCGVGGGIIWVDGGRWTVLMGRWGWMEVYFGWVRVCKNFL